MLLQRTWFKYLLLLWLCCCSNAGFAIISLHPHSAGELSIGDQVDILQDPEGRFSLQDVISSHDFVASNQRRPAFGFSTATYWVRLRVANLSTNPDWILEVGYPPLDHVEFFAPDPQHPGRYQHQQGGDLAPLGANGRTEIKPRFALLRDAKVHTYYLRIRSQSSIIIPLRLVTAERLQYLSQRENYFQGTYLGLISVMALYNLFIFVVIRDRSYLYYTAFISSAGIFQIALHGYASVYLWPHSIWWNNISNLFAACLSVGFLAKFAQRFMQLKLYHSGLNQLLGLGAVLGFVAAALSLLLDYRWGVMMISLVSLTVIPLSLGAAILAWRKGSRPAVFYLIAWCVLLGCALFHVLTIMGILPAHPLLDNAIQIGGALEAVLLSMGLADRINGLQRAALESARSANRLKDDFMATITHELLTPVNGVKLSLDLLRPRLHDQEDRQLLKTATDSSTHLLNLIESMISFVELRRGKAQLASSPLDLNWLLTSVYDYFESINNNNSLHFHYQWDDQIPALILGDEKKITSVVVELMKNAYAFTRQGHISIAAYRNGAQICISVSDTGQGINEEKLQRILDAFEQGDKSALRTHGGLGIGLTLSNDVLRLMGSKLQIVSAPDQGTSVTFCLPLQTAATGLTPVSEGTTAPLQPPPPNCKILVAEDNPVNATLLSKLLENAHYVPIIAANGKEALQALEQHPEIRAVLMDCQMPVMDGLQATRIIRSQSRHQTLPVIAVTANISAEDHDRCREAGMNEILTKPVRRTQVEQALQRWLQ